MAPEVVKTEPHGKAVDWWGLGVLLHELLTGSTPFAHSNYMMVQRKILKDSIEPPEGMDEVLPMSYQ